MKSKLLVLGVVALSVLPTQAVEKVVYGVDNRFELSRSPYANLKNSVAGMLSKYDIKEVKAEDGEVQSYEVKYFGDLTTYQGRKTCDDMRFREQSTAASCTGFLVGEDLLVTAGHCMLRYGQKVQNQKTYSCMTNNWVFGYDQNSEKDGKLNFGKDDVYSCATVIAGEYNQVRDYALIKLNKKTVNKTPVKLNSDADNYKNKEDIFVVGHPTGLPIKIAAGAQVVKDQDSSRFLTNLDTFAGNSGSPIFNFYGEVIGILVSGETDYFYDTKRACYSVNVCTGFGENCNSSISGKARGETGTKISLVEEALKLYNEGKLTAAKSEFSQAYSETYEEEMEEEDEIEEVIEEFLELDELIISLNL